MSWRRCDAHTKRVSSSFTIEALIAKDGDDHEVEEDLAAGSRNSLEDERTHQAATKQPYRVELNAGRLDRTHLSESSSRSFRKPPLRDDDDGDDDEATSRQTSTEARRDCDTTASDQRQHRHQYNQQHFHPYQHHLQQFQQLLGRPVQSVIDTVHPLIRQNVLNSSQLAATDAILRRPPGTSTSVAVPNSLFCCPSLAQSPAAASQTHQRPGGSRDDDLVPFYSWLLSRHGAFFNHRIHPASGIIMHIRPCTAGQRKRAMLIVYDVNPLMGIHRATDTLHQ